MTSRDSIAAFRFGYGFRPGETPERPGAMLAAVAAEAERAAARPGSLRDREAAFARYRAVIRDPAAGAGARDRARREIRLGLARDRAARLQRAVFSSHAFYERLVWFWTDHFSVSAQGVRAQAIVPAFEAEAIRPNVAGKFGALLRAAVEHPAMLDYLGQSRSVGPTSEAGLARGAGLNENLAREVLELHTLGVGAGYRQRDVRQLAELLTGLAVDRKAGATVFRPRIAEPGAEEVLGRRYGGGDASLGDIDAALEDLALRRATARHVVRKLAVHFVADDPDPDLVAALEQIYRDTRGDLMAVYAVLLEHPASWRGLGAKVRQPFDFVVASLRATLPAGAGDLAALEGTVAGDPVAAVARMNQPIWGAPGPDGWPEAAEAWVTAPGMVARLDWASRLGTALERRLDPRDLVDTALGELAAEETRFVATAAAERWEGIALVLAAPEFNRR
jgi:uncharacterized protein (DUF1800 family)